VSAFYRLIASGLTLGRFVATPLFLYFLVTTVREPQAQCLEAFTLLYLAIALSDLFDGFFARLAQASSHRWARLDALADILFNASSLLVASWLGLVGVWVPLGIIALATVFAYRNRGARAAGRVTLSEDPLGKAAGVVYYLFLGVVVSSLWFRTDMAYTTVWWVGNVVFVYTMAVLSRNVMAAAFRRE
jgi:CDP-diacylglycerol--glycerol-3-phosphate 3-phosphatidyltransferase